MTHNTREVEEIPKFYAGGKALAKGEVVVTYRDHLQQLQKARKEERERNVKLINNIIQQSSDDSSDGWFDALRCARETIKANHSELDQDKQSWEELSKNLPTEKSVTDKIKALQAKPK